MSIAIAVVTYNRPKSLIRLLQTLQNADYSETAPLIISIDKGRGASYEEVCRIADSVQWPHGKKIIRTFDENQGLRKHVLSIGDYLDEFDAVIVLEDDIVVSPGFYKYAQAAVEKYADNPEIAGVSLYGFQRNYHDNRMFAPIRTPYDVYFMQSAQSWGQVWMRKQWKAFKEWYQIHNDDFGEASHLPSSICRWSRKSWLKYHTRYCIENNKFFVYPYIALSSNCGDSGSHARYGSPLFQVDLDIVRNTYSFPQWGAPNVAYYDAFFENLLLPKCLQLAPSDLCVDLWGLKQNRECKRYWLTTLPANYKIVQSFGLIYYPIDQNVLQAVEGESIMLYDTNVVEDGKITVVSHRRSFAYLYRYDIIDILRSIKWYGLGRLLKLFAVLIRTKYF